MKPQALQEAIKARATARANKIQEKGWKDPKVKVHKVTAAELKEAKEQKSPAAAAPLSTVSAPPAINMDAFTSILDEMKVCLGEMKHHRAEMSTFKQDVLTAVQSSSSSSDNEQARSSSNPQPAISNDALSKLKNDIVSALAAENKSLREEIEDQQSEIETLGTDLARFKRETLAALREENKALREELQAIKSSIEKIATSSGKIEKEASSVGKNGDTKAKKPLEPHTASDLFEFQRKDKALREYMALQKGLYPSKHMSVQEYSGHNIVLFKKKIYIPAKLREKTIKWYFANHAGSDPKQALSKNCIWPELEQDVVNYENRQ